ncbi:lipase 3-like [Ceratina calcarata]|uniref:Lipase 3-like n=1 Tax=Ceratina calcarata TaxID=156304 RepID=A0AAJ7J8N5_9HYME|nr:lipase 3-like [Ceratina calcarata]
MINYIVQTKQSLLRAYIGYSMGTTAFFVLSSERPQVTRMVQSAYLLAPIAYLQYQKSPVLQHLSLAKDPLKTTFDILSHGEFLQDDVVLRKFMKYICSFNILEEKICSNVFFSIVGFDNKEFDYKLMPKLVNYLPAGGSIKQIVHYAQSIQYGYFRQYDYGRYKNLKIYNSIEPPKYNISRIITPIAMFWGENDWLSTPKDVTRFVKKLPHKPIFYTVPYKKFNHLDFLVAKDVRELVFDKLIDILTNNKLNLHLET